MCLGACSLNRRAILPLYIVHFFLIKIICTTSAHMCTVQLDGLPQTTNMCDLCPDEEIKFSQPPPKSPWAPCLGGSYGRRTVLRGNSDGTLVVFFGDLEQFQDQEERQYELLGKIWARMKHCECTLNLAAKMELQNTNRSSRVTVQLSTKQQSITFNVLPAFNALGEPCWVYAGWWGGLEVWVWKGLSREQSQ
ncbi:hypothetical protein FD755_025247 [Muntiacus reevesi]|uniref:Uncharacterized protein n=1 Tax=Muntiacus reevesi TaxID=9886 RepID=A0A5N3UPB2_MUNRE|nr:hypothetical protein FD755_025248 [Muntiacus reevesi]KAB0338440.1 hypothetical protein FD755_025247 [Muntiacus reevesi]